jgi:hypothetical protein
MKRDRASDTDPGPVEMTDPAGVRPLDTTQPMAPTQTSKDADLDDDEAVKLIQVLERQPRRPPPIVDERASSDGGAFVGYGGAERTPPRALSPGEHHERVLVELAALAGVPDPKREEREGDGLGLSELADTHVLPRRRRGRTLVTLVLVGAAVLAGVAGAIVLARPTTATSQATAVASVVHEPARATSDPLPVRLAPVEAQPPSTGTTASVPLAGSAPPRALPRASLPPSREVRIPPSFPPPQATRLESPHSSKPAASSDPSEPDHNLLLPYSP